MMRILLVLLASSLCITTCTNLSAAQAPAPATVSLAAEQAAREEIVRRQEAQITSRRLIDQGQKFYAGGQYQDAITKLAEALKLLPNAKATEADRDRAVRALTDSYCRLADASLRAGDNDKARTLAQKALEYDPKNRSAEGIIVKIKQAQTETRHVEARPAPVPPTPALNATPEFVAKKDQIKKLFREGKILMSSGQYDEAERRFQQILLLDPYNEDATTLIKSVSVARTDISQGAADVARVRRLEEVTDAWVPPISREVQAPKVEMMTGPIGREAARQADILKKLNEIIIPEINYREAVVSDVITFLSEESRRLDPEKVGVNIVLSSGGGAPPILAGAAAPAGRRREGFVGAPAPVAAAAPAAAAGDIAAIAGRQITLSLRNVPLIEALKYVTTLANLKYRIEPSAVIILPLDAPEGDFITRSYPVNPGAFRTTLAAPGAAAGGAGAAAQGGAATGGGYRALGAGALTTTMADVRQLFTDAGVPFPPGSSLVYNERTSTIIIRNTPENVEIFERVLSAYNFVPSQIEIEARFVGISQSDLDELGFNWQVGSKMFGSFDATGGSGAEAFPPGSGAAATPSYDISQGLRDSSIIKGNAIDALLAGAGASGAGSAGDTVATIRGILTNPQFQVIIKALNQKQSSDTLSAPKVTTISGVQAQIRVVQEFIYPTTFTAATVTAPTYSGTVVVPGTTTPATPGGFSTREVGVILNVTPQVGADGYTINLTLAPEVSEFLGFIDYGGPFISSGYTIQNPIKQPLFSSQSVTTSIVIWDGQTVVLGGLMTEQLQKIDDKIPFLGDIPVVGRLFRSKVTTRSKRNLLIFVTARLIDPAGNPIHRTETVSLR